MRYWIASTLMTLLTVGLILGLAYNAAPGPTVLFIGFLAVLVAIAAGTVLLEPRGKK